MLPKTVKLLIHTFKTIPYIVWFLQEYPKLLG